MASLEAIGRLFLIVAGIFAILGLALVLGGHLPYLSRLPGDVFVRRGNFSRYFPLVTGLLFSLALTVLLNLGFWL